MNSQHLQDVEKEILKNLIVAPQDGCKTMAIGTLTVIGVYVALLGNLFDKKLPIHSFGGIAGIFGPIVLFIFAALLFGLGYLPKKIAKVFPNESASSGEENADQGEANARKRIEAYEKHIRDYLLCGIIIFWVGVISGLLFLILYPKP